jgi:hypothetical protein
MKGNRNILNFILFSFDLFVNVILDFLMTGDSQWKTPLCCVCVCDRTALRSITDAVESKLESTVTCLNHDSHEILCFIREMGNQTVSQSFSQSFVDLRCLPCFRI